MNTQTTTTAKCSMTSSFSEDQNPHSERPVTTWAVQWEKGSGYQIDTNSDERVNVKANVPQGEVIPAVAPDPKLSGSIVEWWCVVSKIDAITGEVGAVHGPYTSREAAQSLIDEGRVNGLPAPMTLI